MKVNLHPIIKKLSGKIKGLVFVSKKNQMVGDENKINTEVYIRSVYKKLKPPSIKQTNMNTAFKIMASRFNELKTDTLAYETWKTEAKILETKLNRTVTAYLLFTTYYMTNYTHTLGIDVLSNSLSNGSSLSWQDRDTRLWNQSIPTSYGTGSFDTGTYST